MSYSLLEDYKRIIKCTEDITNIIQTDLKINLVWHIDEANYINFARGYRLIASVEYFNNEIYDYIDIIVTPFIWEIYIGLVKKDDPLIYYDFSEELFEHLRKALL
jgi:hypothetical protein